MSPRSCARLHAAARYPAHRRGGRRFSRWRSPTAPARLRLAGPSLRHAGRGRTPDLHPLELRPGNDRNAVRGRLASRRRGEPSISPIYYYYPSLADRPGPVAVVHKDRTVTMSAMTPEELAQAVGALRAVPRRPRRRRSPDPQRLPARAGAAAGVPLRRPVERAVAVNGPT